MSYCRMNGLRIFAIHIVSMPAGLSNQIQFKALFEYASEGILVADASGAIQLVNRAAETLFEYAPGELTGKLVEVLIPQRYSRHHGALRDKFNDNPQPRAMGSGRDLYGITKNGREFPVEISLSPYATENGNFTIAFIIDISVRKKNEEAIALQKQELEKLAEDLEKRVKDRTMILEEALQQLEISRKELHEALEKEKELNEMKSRFVSMASHEFRTPLATILSSLSLVNKYAATDNKEKQEHHIQRIKSSISNMTDLLDDVLSISKLEEGMIEILPENMDLPAFTNAVIQDLQAVAKNGQTINYHHEGEYLVHFDKKVLRVILMNLISNAIKFSGDGTVIAVRSVISDTTMTIAISDQGIGITQEDKVHLFERFYRGHNALNIQGTGLGLSIVARYVDMLHGTISVDSEPNTGTTFTILLPKQSMHG